MRLLFLLSLVACLALAACESSATSHKPTPTTTPSGTPLATPSAGQSPSSEVFSLSAKAAKIEGSLSIAGAIVSVHVDTNFPIFKSGYYVTEMMLANPESASIPMPKCGTHDGMCRMESNVLDDKIDCDGICHPGDYLLTVTACSAGDSRMEQSPSYVAWVGGPTGKNLSGNPLAITDPKHPEAQCLRKVVTLTRTSY
jgi:hypothetical protein